ncbi:CoA ester lyase [Arhodomonas aquaeolei]|uniref:HpcH/HpaI aldolase/citrate lyase family protein n=1 Tax=Arhodomonas aquaeolei TaxID=2369 RepID=UPI002169204D|nr:CoA ester lyase [Arhodomonas aquaeolei]MCS4504779.1 CoA ester lyase [Arhodomonas aquaeolei]
MTQWPGWRSLLFVPADNERLLEKAGRRGADACILDLEDAVAPERRPAARAALPTAIARLAADGVAVLVRVNAGTRAQVHDLEAAVGAPLAGIVLPKVEHAHEPVVTDGILTELETERGLEPGGVPVIGMIESARGLLAAGGLAAATPRLAALALGPEDLALDLGGTPGAALLTEPARRVAWAARAAGIEAIGFPGSIANYTDTGRLSAELETAQGLGFSGALCIHPAQIGPVHAAFAVSEADLDWARRVVDAAPADGAVFSVDGRMVDRPVLLRARALLARGRRQRGR